MTTTSTGVVAVTTTFTKEVPTTTTWCGSRLSSSVGMRGYLPGR
jgi:hypothetical protein